MPLPPKTIVLEFNELCPSLLERFMDAGDLPNFRRLYESSVVRTTDCGESAPYLEPWIQWPTVHFGVSRHEHGAFSLGDGRNYDGDGIATILSGAGIRVGIFGSMNTNYERLNGYYIPDAWDARGHAYPDELESFSQFVARQVQESSRANGTIGLRDALQFLRFIARNTITGATWSPASSTIRWKRMPTRPIAMRSARATCATTRSSGACCDRIPRARSYS